ncbi:unnamed protein product [Adineta steineri]|uniref:Uncharacterized protein n=1 Tax=Adineta steineri TaxID=433720 RepID=A0A819ETR3_9BILA|nr:unnamed protein product [Adineta steineri]
MTGTNSSDFSSLDIVLRNVASRNYHGIVRVDVDFPGQTLSLFVPDFLYNRLTETVGATNQWRSQPVGGEVRPELMPCAFASNPVTALPINN